MRLVRVLIFPSAAVLLLASIVSVLYRGTSTASAQTTTPPTSTISSGSGPLVWDFAPVVGGTVTNVGIQDVCPPGMCDDHDLNIVLPSAAATFYQTNTAQVTFKYTWTSAVPADLDIFAISPNGADHGPGSPDDTSTGAGEEDLTLTDPVPGLWHIRSVAALVPVPTGAHVVVTMTVAPRPHHCTTSSAASRRTHFRQLSSAGGLSSEPAVFELHHASARVYHLERPQRRRAFHRR